MGGWFSSLIPALSWSENLADAIARGEGVDQGMEAGYEQLDALLAQHA